MFVCVGQTKRPDRLLLLSHWAGAHINETVLCICDKNSADNASLFWPLLSSAITGSRLSFQTTSAKASRLGIARGCEGTLLGQLTAADQRNVPYHMMSRSAVKAGGKEEERKNS